ncbi:MAG: cytochrome c biogenesis protein ResB [Azoarcus sp.]|jgi:cytochrome c biogenesis protein|nr:cytochrome c biogenesis protein ResB [Azoarcus sp.]
MPRNTLVDLLSSMRFAISLLTVLAIASIIGTVARQNEPLNAYLNQFGQFWFPVFDKLTLYSVYNAGWFIAILAFLVLSTTLCLIRQAAPMLREMRGFREHAREESLRLFHHQASLAPTLPVEARRAVVETYLAANGFQFKSDERENALLIAAKQGGAGRIGYFFAHGAIVLICLGGLMDGNLPLRMQMFFSGKAPTNGNQLIADIPESARLDVNNWSYRANVYIPEGRSSSFGVVGVGDGILLQPLPFSIALKRFHVDHYENGMPRRFASDVVITDSESGERFEHSIEVNKPLEYRGVTLYQASFDDGGSILHLSALGLAPGAQSVLDFSGEVGSGVQLGIGGQDYRLELTGLRPLNVENTGSSAAAGGTEDGTGGTDGTGGRTGGRSFSDFTGSGARAPDSKTLTNVGPSYSFKLRDSAGQALEFNNYMLPIQLEGRWYLFSGVRASQAEPFRYLRIPLDDASGDIWFALRRVMLDPVRHAALARRFAEHNVNAATDSTLRERIQEAAEHTLTLFASGGFDALGRFIEAAVPETERDNTGTAFIKILQGLAWESWMMAREDAGQPLFEASEEHARFVRDSLTAINDSMTYGAPVYLRLSAFEQRQASVLQAARSPGKTPVYLGALLLVIGVFTMLYVRERRLFVLLNNDEALLALSSNRKTLDIDETFARHREALAAALGAGNNPSRSGLNETPD